MLDLQLHVQSVPITTNVLSSNSVHGVVYSMEHYVIKFVSDLRQVGGFLRHDIIEILLKVALNTVNQSTNLIHGYSLKNERLIEENCFPNLFKSFYASVGNNSH